MMLMTMMMMTMMTPRLDVMNLQEQLDLKLQQRQARETGICQVSFDFETLGSNSIKFSSNFYFSFRLAENCTPSASMNS